MTEPFGQYAPTPTQKKIIAMIRRLPHNWLGQRLGYALRKLVHRDHLQIFDLEVFDLKLRLRSYDNKCEKRVVCMPQFFDPEERKILKDFAKSRQSFTFIDLGANIGLYSLYLSSLNLPHFKCLAIEADPEIYSRLAYNIEVNKLPIQIKNVAVSDKNGFLDLFINPKNRGENSAVDQNSELERTRVRCQTLIDLMDKAGIKKADAIKLDLEGAENNVLTHLFENGTEERFPDLILIEDAPDRWEDNAFSLIEKHGYRLSQKTKCNRIYRLKS